MKGSAGPRFYVKGAARCMWENVFFWSKIGERYWHVFFFVISCLPGMSLEKWSLKVELAGSKLFLLDVRKGLNVSSYNGINKILLQQISESCSLNPFDEDMRKKGGALDVRRRKIEDFASKHGTVESVVFWSSRVHQCVHYSNSCLKKAWRGGPEYRLASRSGSTSMVKPDCPQDFWHWYLWISHPRHLSDLSVSFSVE